MIFVKKVNLKNFDVILIKSRQKRSARSSHGMNPRSFGDTYKVNFLKRGREDPTSAEEIQQFDKLERRYWIQ